MEENYLFKLDFQVRDYECDLAGMVNNATYLNYLEHTRLVFLKSRDVDFADLARQGIYLIVLRIEADYLLPLRSGDRFSVGLKPSRISRLRLGFDQDIYRISDEKPVLRAKVITSAVNDKGRPFLPEGIVEKILAGNRGAQQS